MQNQYENLEKLRIRIAQARSELGFDLELMKDIAAYAEARRSEGMTLDDVSDELTIPLWELKDWIQRPATGVARKRRRRRKRGNRKFMKVVIDSPIEVRIVDATANHKRKTGRRDP